MVILPVEITMRVEVIEGDIAPFDGNIAGGDNATLLSEPARGDVRSHHRGGDWRKQLSERRLM